MATTTDILFNSPALHSLKRDQLVKLCKIHYIKANGKNTELIERLKMRALELPPEAQTESAEDGDPDAMDVEPQALAHNDDEERDLGLPGGMPADPPNDGDYDMQDVVLTSRFAIPRPSEQWEVVMEDIEEVDERTMGTASSKNSLRTISGGEFGTHSSRSTVSLSIRALATSLGINRVASKSSHPPQDIDAESTKMPSFSPGKLFGSARARDSLAEHAMPYSEIPPSDSLPETDHFKFSTPDASILDMSMGEEPHAEDDDGPSVKSLPKPAPRMGVAVGGGVKSTIRLVSHPAIPKTTHDYYAMSPPRLPVFKTDFELAPGTPGTTRSLSLWPATPHTLSGDTQSLYPKLPLEDLKPSGSATKKEEGAGTPGSMGMGIATSTPAKIRPLSIVKNSTSTPKPVDAPDIFSPAKASVASGSVATGSGTPGASTSRAPIPRSAPFLFGSPLPARKSQSAVAMAGKADDKNDTPTGVSNAAFDGVAKSVLEEMHRRLAEAGAQNGQDRARAPQPFDFTFGTAGGAGGGSGAPPAQDRFAKAHDTQFNKMDSIATHYAARRPNKRKSDALGARPVAGQKRRSSAAGARVISAGTRKKMVVPGGFGGEDDDAEDDDGKEEEREEEDAGARRSSKRIRITEGWDVHKGQRVSLAPPLPSADEEKKQKEHDAAKRELDALKARRRSSRGRPSMGRPSMAPAAKGKASRFGFLSSAKSLVRNVWNLGGGSKAKGAPSSSIPVPSNSAADKKTEKVKAEAASKPAAESTRKVSGPSGHLRVPSTSSTSNKLLKPKPSDAKSVGTVGTVASTKSTSARARSPIPSFAAPSGTVKSTTTAGTARSRMSSMNGSNAGTVASRQTSAVSSIGTRSSVTGSTAVSSIGTRRSLASTNTLASSTSSRADAKVSPESAQPSLRKRTSSLLAPTASSLAKVNAAVKPSMSGRTSGLPPVAEAQKPKRASILQPRASSSKATSRLSPNPMSPPPLPRRIFSQPLTNFGSPAGTDSGATPVHHPSLTAAVTSIMGEPASSPSKIPRPAVLPPKPKQLIARKPRISRSRVIAKLGAQRAAAAQSAGLGSPGGGGGASARAGGRTRSSIGARKSFGGVKSGGRASLEVTRSAAMKKRARQSEYSRRRSRAENENEVDAADDD